MSYQALLFCPDEKTARVVTQVLTELDFTVEPCNETFAAVKKLMAQHFDAIVVDCDNEQNATLLFKSARNSAPNQSSLSVAVVEGQAGVAKAFRIGANLVLTKPINVEQSKGTLRVARGLLRKADAGKPASAPAPQISSPSLASLNAARPEGGPAFPERPVAPFPSMSAKQTGLQDSGASGFELEKEESPEPEPEEAALLESLPDLPRAKSPSFSSKDLPWQPISMPASAEESARPEVSPRAAERPISQPLGFGDPKKPKESSAPSVASFNSGSAAAPAPAREVSRPTVKAAETKVASPKESSSALALGTIPTTAPAVEPPMFSALSVKDHEAGSEGSSKKPFVFVVAAVLLIAAGYVGWTRFRPSFGQSAAQAPATQAAVSVPVAALPSESQPVTPAPNNESAVAPAPRESAQFIAPDSTRSLQAGTTIASSAKPTAAIKAGAPEPSTSTAKASSPAAPASQPLVIKNDSPRQTAAKEIAEAAQPSAPAALGIGTNNDDRAIAGIMSSTPVAVPRPAVQTLRISQGVSQGLLAKRVQPIYPPTAMQMRLQGAVLLDAMIGKDGSIVSVKRISGDNILARAAIDAVKQWKYKPYYLNGEPVEIGTQITVNFKLP